MNGVAVSCRIISRERGSALLVVLVFAAIIAIALYKELPVEAFEARRGKEQLLVDRGNEYKQAVRLFVRRLGTYPASLDALENTNNVRFLRRRYTDPFTHKDDWRLLHAGPGGILLDSKINPVSPDGTAANARGSSDAQALVNPVRSRAPAISAASTGVSVTPEPDPTASLLASGAAQQLTDNSPAATDTQSRSQAAGASPAESSPGPSPLDGQVFGGMIAGIASNAQGHSIKLIGKQADYSLWEFYYDPLTDKLPVPGLLNGTLQTGLGVNGTGAPGTTSVPPAAPNPQP